MLLCGEEQSLKHLLQVWNNMRVNKLCRKVKFWVKYFFTQNKTKISLQIPVFFAFTKALRLMGLTERRQSISFSSWVTLLLFSLVHLKILSSKTYRDFWKHANLSSCILPLLLFTSRQCFFSSPVCLILGGCVKKISFSVSFIWNTLH